MKYLSTITIPCLFLGFGILGLTLGYYSDGQFNILSFILWLGSLILVVSALIMVFKLIRAKEKTSLKIATIFCLFLTISFLILFELKADKLNDQIKYCDRYLIDGWLLDQNGNFNLTEDFKACSQNMTFKNKLIYNYTGQHWYTSPANHES